MTQAAFSSRILDANRVALAAVDTDVWVFQKSTPMIYACALQMTGGQNILATDAYSHAWFYEGRAGTFDVDRQTNVNNEAATVLVLSTTLAAGNRRCTTDGNSVLAGKELEATGGSAFAFPAIDCNSGQNFESQCAIDVQEVDDRDGAVVVMTMRTAIAIGGGAETPFLAKLRFPKPHAKPVIKHPMPVLRSRAVGKR